MVEEWLRNVSLTRLFSVIVVAVVAVVSTDTYAVLKIYLREKCGLSPIEGEEREASHGGSECILSCLLSLVSCLLSLVSCLLSLVSCLLSLVSGLWSLVSCLVSCLLSLVSLLFSLVSCLLSLCSCLLSLVSLLLSLFSTNTVGVHIDGWKMEN